MAFIVGVIIVIIGLLGLFFLPLLWAIIFLIAGGLMIYFG